MAEAAEEGRQSGEPKVIRLQHLGLHIRRLQRPTPHCELELRIEQRGVEPAVTDIEQALDQAFGIGIGLPDEVAGVLVTPPGQQP